MLMVLSDDRLVAILGTEGIANLLREVARPLEMGVGFVPTNEKLEQEQQQAEEQQQQQTAVASQILQIAVQKGLLKDVDANALMEEVMGGGEQQQQQQ